MVHVRFMRRIVDHSERPFAYAIDWMFQRIAGEFCYCCFHVGFYSPSYQWRRQDKALIALGLQTP